MPVRLVADSEGARPCAKHQPQQCNSFRGWVSPQPRSTDALAANRIGTDHSSSFRDSPQPEHKPWDSVGKPAGWISSSGRIEDFRAFRLRAE